MGFLWLTATDIRELSIPPNFLFKNVHEYVLVFAKPRETKTKGPKVRLYNDLMADMQQVVNGSLNGAQAHL